MKVWPKNDSIRKILKHPAGGPFRQDGPAEWPDDSYTARRIADGDVTTDAPHEASEQQAHSQHQPDRPSSRGRPGKSDTE
jgi:hypothetical protein